MNYVESLELYSNLESAYSTKSPTIIKGDMSDILTNHWLINFKMFAVNISAHKKKHQQLLSESKTFYLLDSFTALNMSYPFLLHYSNFKVESDNTDPKFFILHTITTGTFSQQLQQSIMY